MGYTALFGGTFNPLHIGHYEMLEALCEREDISEVWLMPDRIPPHKTCDFLASDADRIQMCRIAAEDFPKARVSEIEFERDEKSYSYDTVMLLKARYPDKRFVFACGADMIATLDSWYRASELILEIPFIAFNRAEDENFLFHIERMKSLGAQIEVIEREIPAVSSTELRLDIKKGEKSSLIPQKIAEYIFERNLYV